MSERPTREECIAWLNFEATTATISGVKEHALATIHYLTEDATPPLFPVEEPA